MSQKRSTWSNQFAFILAAAASAIGLGNLWRFPYLAAQYGGGTFILVYLILVVTLGFTLMTIEISIGRKTKQSQLTAYTALHPKFSFLGILATIIPVVIVPYYCVIGGWVIKYFTTYCKMIVSPKAELINAANAGDFFGGFISSNFGSFGYGMIFIFACAIIIALGVKNGIEKSNKIMMPLLFFMAIGISIYVCTMDGAIDGLKYYLVPNTDCLRTEAGEFSPAQLGKTILGAMGQMFYSLSLAMGIMITYGSYLRKEDSIEKSVRRIEIFDTLIAIVAGLMIIPVVYVYAVKTGVTPELIAECGGDTAAATTAAVKEAMNAGPGLMFITLPKVFDGFGAVAPYVGATFFLLVIFAALTSAISLYETCVASICDLLNMERKNATFFAFFAIAFLATFSALGYGPWSHITICKLQFLDFFDFVTNSVLMPLVAAATCIFVGWVIKTKVIEDEVESCGTPFKSRKLFVVMTKYIAPILVTLILVGEILRNTGFFKI